MKLLGKANAKTVKGEKKGYITFILNLAPANLSGQEVCPKRSVGCTEACLNTAGQAGMLKPGQLINHVGLARLRRTKQFFEDRIQFMNDLHADIVLAKRQADKKDMTLAIRLNGTSDLSWEKYPMGDHANVFEAFPDVQFYDYTKVLGRKVSHIKNYHLTFSQSESNIGDVKKAIDSGMNVATVFDKVPAQHMGLPVVNGDESDLRFLDAANSIVGLKAKGKAKKDTSGFVIFLKKA